MMFMANHHRNTNFLRCVNTTFLATFATIYFLINVLTFEIYRPKLLENSEGNKVGRILVSTPKNGSFFTKNSKIHKLLCSDLLLLKTQSSKLMTLCSGSESKKIVLTDNLEIFQNANSDFPSYLANKLLILFGDSNDRNVVKHLCKLSYNSTLTRATLGSSEVIDEGYNESPSDCLICVVRRKNSVFVAISIFHFGLLQPFDRIRHSLFPLHLRPEENHTVHGRIRLIKQLVQNMAPLCFPELNDLTPSLIVAHSSLWDLAMFNFTNPTLVANFLPQWKQAMEEQLKSRLYLEFGENLFNRVVKLTPDEYETIIQMETTESNFVLIKPTELLIPRLYIRTCPIPMKIYPIYIVKAMNHWITSSSSVTNMVDKPSNYMWGVMDWASLLKKSYTPTMANDGFHSNEQGIETFWKLILSRFYLLADS